VTIDDQPPVVPEASGTEEPADKELPHEKLMRVGQSAVPDRRISLLVLIALVGMLALSGGWPLLVVVVAIVFMIFLHELGHFITAKLSGMKVTEFFLGFGPRLFSFQRGETEYGVKAIPAGAYVRIIGMNNLEEVPPEDEARTYRAQTYPRRLAVAVAGSAMHFMLAILSLFLMLTATGAPGGHVFIDNQGWQIGQVVDGSAASAAGLQSGDRIETIDGHSVAKFDDLHDLVFAQPGKTVALVVNRHGQRLDLNATIGTESGHGLLGVSSASLPRERVNPITAAGRSVTEFGAGVKESLSALGSFFSPSGLSSFASDVANGGSPTVTNDNHNGSPAPNSEPSEVKDRPVSIVGAAVLGSDLTREGPYAFLAFFATINLFIGIVNLVPLLPLDGGHVAIATYERLRSRRGRRYQVDVVKLLPLTYAVVMVLGLLFVSTLFLDLVDPIRLN